MQVRMLASDRQIYTPHGLARSRMTTADRFRWVYDALKVPRLVLGWGVVVPCLVVLIVLAAVQMTVQQARARGR